jgi:tetratricopeptide (TPR) repeat protein
MQSYEVLFQRNPDNFDYGLRLLRMQTKADTDKARQTMEALKRMRPGAEASAEMLIAEAEMMRGQPLSDVLPVLRRAREMAEEQGARLVAATASLHVAEVNAVAGELDEALQEAARAKEIFQASGDKDGIIQALSLEAVVMKKRGDDRGVQRRLEQADELAGQIDSVRSLTTMRLRLVDVAIQQGKLDEGEQSLAEVTTLLARRGLHDEAALGTARIAMLRFQRGDLHKARMLLDRAALDLAEADKPELRAQVLFARAFTDAVAGQEAPARRTVAEAVSVFPRLGDHGAALVLEAILDLHQGLHPAAEEKLRRALTLDKERRLWFIRLERDRLLLESLLGQGKAAEAEAMLERMRADVKVPGFAERIVLELYALRLRAQAARRPAERATIARELEALSERCASADLVYLRFQVDLARGRAEHAAGRPADAARTLALVVRDARRRGFVPLAESAVAALAEIKKGP